VVRAGKNPLMKGFNPPCFLSSWFLNFLRDRRERFGSESDPTSNGRRRKERSCCKRRRTRFDGIHFHRRIRRRVKKESVFFLAHATMRKFFFVLFPESALSHDKSRDSFREGIEIQLVVFRNKKADVWRVVKLQKVLRRRVIQLQSCFNRFRHLLSHMVDKYLTGTRTRNKQTVKKEKLFFLQTHVLGMQCLSTKYGLNSAKKSDPSCSCHHSVAPNPE
jgi:hypothetical protein